MKRIRWIRIKNVTGLRHISILDRLDGKKDCQDGQVCEVEDGLATPRIVQKCRSRDKYCNEIYIKAASELKNLYSDIAVSTEELKCLDGEMNSENISPSENKEFGEEEQRRLAILNAKRTEMTERHRVLTIHLAELKQSCFNINEILRHNIDRAESSLRAHVECYWSGVLKSASEMKYPVMPVLVEEELSGKTIYEDHFSRILHLFETIYDGGECR